MAQNLITVEVSNPAIRDVALSQSISSKLEAQNEVNIVSELSFPAKVIDLKVGLGEKASKGQALVALDNQSLLDQVASAEAGYNIALANLESNRERVEQARLELSRLEILYEMGAVSKQNLEQARLAASDGSLRVLEAQVGQALTGLNQVRNQLNKTIIRAPITGYVADLNVKENEFLTSSQVAMRIVDTDKLKINIEVTDLLIEQVRVGQGVGIRARSINNILYEGKIVALSPVPSARTQLYPIKIEVDNSQGELRPGMFVEVIIDTNRVKEALTVPSNAILTRQRQHFVYVVEDQKAIRTPVEIGLDNGQYVQIISGLDANDEVIVRGQEYVEDGRNVQVIRGEK